MGFGRRSGRIQEGFGIWEGAGGQGSKKRLGSGRELGVQEGVGVWKGFSLGRGIWISEVGHDNSILCSLGGALHKSFCEIATKGL